MFAAYLCLATNQAKDSKEAYGRAMYVMNPEAIQNGKPREEREATKQSQESEARESYFFFYFSSLCVVFCLVCICFCYSQRHEKVVASCRCVCVCVVSCVEPVCFQLHRICQENIQVPHSLPRTRTHTYKKPPPSHVSASSRSRYTPSKT